jgi:hypothetical protein
VDEKRREHARELLDCSEERERERERGGRESGEEGGVRERERETSVDFLGPPALTYSSRCHVFINSAST